MSQLVKVVVTVPEEKADELREAIGSAGGGTIGKYSHASFSVKGVGRFKPKAGATPAVGKVGKLESVAEERIEVTCEKDKLRAVVSAIRDAHSYEEPVIDIYPMLPEG